LPLIVFLHGAGGSAYEMEKVVNPLVEAWKYFIFLPTGTVVKPERHDTKMVRDWDPFRDVASVTGKIETLVKQHDIDPSLVFLSGFSSGATMSYLVGFERPDLFCGLIPFCGTLQGELIDRKKLESARSKLPVCIVHGWQDASVPWDRASAAKSVLQAEGFKVKCLSYYGGHLFPPNWMDILKDAIEWCHNQGEPVQSEGSAE
jgi:phospholipase/carboxylesterase